MRTGISVLPLHGGRAPAWLFKRMVKLAGSITEAIVLESGTEEFLKRVSDPVWFQSLGCILGFDWHSSGLTTTTTGAIKESLKNRMMELGIFVAGGKGKVSRKTPDEIEKIGEKTGINALSLIFSSKAAAKTDSNLLQDGYALYHHTFFFDKHGNWAVVQQGMNGNEKKARRYHWLSLRLISFHEEPHTGIKAEKREKIVLDLTSRGSKNNKEAILKLLKYENPDSILRDYRKIKFISFPARHPVFKKDINEKYFYRILKQTYDQVEFGDFDSLYLAKGVGASTLRALSLLADIIFGARPSFEDPVIYSYAHGGKDGYPYPVARQNYDNTISVLERAIKMAKLGRREEFLALKRLSKFFQKERVYGI